MKTVNYNKNSIITAVNFYHANLETHFTKMKMTSVAYDAGKRLL